jgi:hypothetical protein
MNVISLGSCYTSGGALFTKIMRKIPEKLISNGQDSHQASTISVSPNTGIEHG